MCKILNYDSNNFNIKSNHNKADVIEVNGDINLRTEGVLRTRQHKSDKPRLVQLSPCEYIAAAGVRLLQKFHGVIA